jgi:hypothetical protein
MSAWLSLTNSMVITQYMSQPPPVWVIITTIPQFNAYMYTEWINHQGNTKWSFEDKYMKRWANFTKPTSDMDSLTMKGHINQLKAGLILCSFFPHDFVLTCRKFIPLFESMQSFLLWCNLAYAIHHNFWFKVIWPTWSVAARLVLEASRKWSYCHAIS